jgi:hypothetical protein
MNQKSVYEKKKKKKKNNEREHLESINNGEELGGDMSVHNP